MRTVGLVAKDKAPRKVAKKGQPGGRQEAGKAVLCKAEGKEAFQLCLFRGVFWTWQQNGC